MTVKRDLILLTAGRLSAVLLALISIRAVTTFLSPEQYGEVALFITIQMFCGLFFINPVGQHINLHTHAWWDDGTLLSRLKGYRNYVFVVSLLGGFLVLTTGVQHSAGQWICISAVMMAIIVFGTWNATFIPMLNMLGFRGASVLWSVATALAGLLSSIALVILFPSSIAWFAGQAIGMALGAVAAKYVLHRHSSYSKHAQDRLQLLDKQTVYSYCLPLAIATGLMWLQLSGYRFVIEKYWGLAQLGLLVIGLQLSGQIFSLAESIAMQFFYPLFFRRVSDHQNLSGVESAFSDLLNTLVPLYLVLAGFVIFSAPFLLKILVASKFQNAITFVMLGALIELFRVLGNIFSNAAQVKRKTKSLTLPYALGSIVSLSLIYFSGVAHVEIYWAALALVIGALIMFLVMMMNMYHQVKFRLDLARFLCGVTVMLLLATLAFLMPKVVDLIESIEILLVTSLMVGVVLSVLTWKNPAARKLLNVKLREN